MDCRSCNSCARGRSCFHGRNRIWEKLFYQGLDRSQRHCSWTWLNFKYVAHALLRSWSLKLIHLCPATENVTSYRCVIDGTRFILVDTPGFNDTYRDENAILHEIADWMTKTYATGKRLNGLVYLHPISSTRIEGSALVNLRVFRKLCGADCFKHVFLCSTFWDVTEEVMAIDREKELCESPELWGQMKRAGAQTFRIRNYAQSKAILLEIAKKPTMALELQKEIVDNKVPLASTAAGKLVSEELGKLEAEHKAHIQSERKAAAEQLAAKEAELANQQKMQEEIIVAQAKLAHAQRVEQDRVQQRLRVDAERRAREEQKKRDRLEAEAREKLRQQMDEKKKLEAQVRQQEAARQRQNRILALQNERIKFFETSKTNMYCLQQAQARGTINARIRGIDQQSPTFMTLCDRCFKLIGFRPRWSMSPSVVREI
jgi:hypothetical protein